MVNTELGKTWGKEKNFGANKRLMEYLNFVLKQHFMVNSRFHAK